MGLKQFDVDTHLDKNDPGMPTFLKKLNDRKKGKGKAKPKAKGKSKGKVMDHLQEFVK